MTVTNGHKLEHEAYFEILINFQKLVSAVIKIMNSRLNYYYLPVFDKLKSNHVQF